MVQLVLPMLLHGDLVPLVLPMLLHGDMVPLVLPMLLHGDLVPLVLPMLLHGDMVPLVLPMLLHLARRLILFLTLNPRLTLWLLLAFLEQMIRSFPPSLPGIKC